MIPCVTPPPLCDAPCASAAQVPPPFLSTTPAKAGAQLGDGGNEGKRDITATFPPGPRPPPGRCKGCGLHDAICRYSTSCPQGGGTTPAKAGAQLGDGGNAGQRAVTATFPPGPRPPPGRCKGCGLHDAICRYRTSCPQGDGTTPAKAKAQLGDGGNAEQRVLTATFPIGPRPSPGWSCVGADPAIGTQANENAPPHQPRRPPIQPRRHVRYSLRYCPPPAATP